MHPLASYLQHRLPDGLGYWDATELCLRLYCTAGGVPGFLRSTLTREGLAEAFSELARRGWVHDIGSPRQVLYGAQFHEVNDQGHWIEVMASVFKSTMSVVDFEKGEELARRAGFEGGTEIRSPVP
jgi:hypothetical protein